MIKFSEIPYFMRWLTYTSFFRYGYEGALVSVYGCNRTSLECPQEFCYFASPTKIMKFMNMEDAVYSMDLIFLLAFLIILRVVTFFILRWKINSKF